MNTDQLSSMLGHTSNIVYVASRKESEFHEHPINIPKPYNYECYYPQTRDAQGQVLRIHKRVGGVLVGQKHCSVSDLEAPHAYERAEYRPDWFKGKNFTPYLSIEKIIVSQTAETRDNVRGLLLKQIKKECEQKFWDYLCVKIPIDRNEEIDNFEQEGFQLHPNKIADDGRAYWMTWPDDWNKRWV